MIRALWKGWLSIHAGRNYLLQVAAWVFAWAPGILILTTDRLRRRAART